jgi:L,D-transpeptidase YcbB
MIAAALVLIPLALASAPEGLQRLIPEGNSEISRFYEASGGQSVWIQDGQPTPRALEMIDTLRDAAGKGLDPEDYDASKWPGRLAEFRPPFLLPPPEEDLSRFDLDLTTCAMRYVSDLRFGRVPSPYESGPKDGELSTLTREVLTTDDLGKTLTRLEPPFPGYKRALEALQRYRTLAREDDGERLPFTAKPVDPGTEYPGVPRLTRLLRNLGDLPADAAASDSFVYSGALVDALKHFQTRHGLDADGRIGKATLAELNTPLSQRVRQLELTLERWRSVPHEFSRPPVVLNIPEFRLRAYNASYEPELEMKIVTGKAQRLQTPLFSGRLQYVIFRPYWNVPLSIQRKELVPEIARDWSYLAKNNYEVITPQGVVVSRSTVSDDMLAQLRSGKLLLRQTPGPKNALGLIKFVFPNSYDVYLHDTPAKNLFSRTRRDFSHGCIRLEKAEDLAVWVLRDEPGWPRERIDEAMMGQDDFRVNLKRPIPVLVVYGTAVALENGEVHFFDDIYGYDVKLERELTARHPLG